MYFKDENGFRQKEYEEMAAPLVKKIERREAQGNFEESGLLLPPDCPALTARQAIWEITNLTQIGMKLIELNSATMTSRFDEHADEGFMDLPQAG